MLGERFFVVYGDSYLECDYADVARRFDDSAKLGLMTVFRNEGQWDTSNVEYAGGRILAYDKQRRTGRMQYIDWGLGVFRREAFDTPENAAAADLAAVYQNLLRSGQLAAYEATNRFYEIGSFEGIEELSRHLRNQMTFSEQFLQEARQVIDGLDPLVIERMAALLAATRERGGRLFILGVGGSAANASHAVNDFRKIAGIEAYAPTDNVSELTARTNDEGWAGVFESWLRVSRLKAEDTVLVFSVGGGNLEKNVSPNLVAALQLRERGGGRHPGDRGTGRRLHGQGGRRLRDRPHRQRGAHHAARRGVSGGGMAPAGIAPGGEAGGDQMGIGAMKPGGGRAVFLDRDGVLNRAIVRNGKPYPPASRRGDGADALRAGPACGGSRTPGFCCWWSPTSRTWRAARRPWRRSRPCTNGCAPSCRWTISWCATTTTAMPANAASRSPGFCSRAPAAMG